jgi:hypothetical protein
MKATVQFNLRCTPEELEQIKQSAMKQGKSANQYIIDSALNGQTKPVQQPLTGNKPSAPKKENKPVKTSGWSGGYGKDVASR